MLCCAIISRTPDSEEMTAVLNVKADIRFAVAPEAVLPVRVPLWRILHDVELGSVRNVTLSNGAPEVHRLEPYHMTRFTKSWQELSFEMNNTNGLSMTPEKWANLYSDKTVITNEQGMGNPDDPRRNYITGEDLDADELPKVASLVFGGNVLTGVEDGEWLVVRTLNASMTAPPLEYILARPWLRSIGTNVSKNGSVGRLPQGSGRDVLLPIYASKPVKFPLSKLKRLADNEPIPSVYLA